MILADASVWVNHFRHGSAELRQLLLDGYIAIHPFIVGEIACGNLHSRSKVLGDLQRLPLVIEAAHNEVLVFLERHGLFGKGITWIDAHLLASARLSACTLWTLDSRLHSRAMHLHLAHHGR